MASRCVYDLVEVEEDQHGALAKTVTVTVTRRDRHGIT